MADALEESLKDKQQQLNNLYANMGYLYMQNEWNSKKIEELKAEGLALAKKVQNLQANQPKKEESNGSTQESLESTN